MRSKLQKFNGHRGGPNELQVGGTLVKISDTVMQAVGEPMAFYKSVLGGEKNE